MADVMDPRLEARLRTDPTGDPLHVTGQFRDRVVGASVVHVRGRASTVALRPLGAAVAVAVLLVTVLVVRPLITGPAASPSPLPTATPAPTFTPLPTSAGAQLGPVALGWLNGIAPGNRPPIEVTLIGPTNTTASFVDGALPGNPPDQSSARIGEVSRDYVAAGILVIDDCSQVASAFSCRKGIFPTTMRIDDPISRWYPGWPASDATTIRELLDGSSGLAPVATDMADLSAQIAAKPGTDWSRDAVLGRAIAAPRRFAAGAQHQPADSEWLLLEAIMERATGKPSSQVIPTEGFALPFNSTFADQPPISLMAGRNAGGAKVLDLDPTSLALVGNAGGMAAPSSDLADYAITAWTNIDILNPSIVDLLTDAAHGHALPLGAVGVCPCQGTTRLVLEQVGRAGGWSTAIAYDFGTKTAVGVAVGGDEQPADLEALVQALLAIPPP